MYQGTTSVVPALRSRITALTAEEKYWKMLRETQCVKFLVGAPAFMRGKERFSAPGKVRR